MSGLTDREEDYLRALFEITSSKGYARIKDVARQVDVTPSSAVEMMRKLSEKNLVNYVKYEGITLTEAGRQYAEAVTRRHSTFREFLRIINVPDDIAERDAHILEHHLDVRTINQFSRFVEIISNPDAHPRFVSVYRDILADLLKKGEDS